MVFWILVLAVLFCTESNSHAQAYKSVNPDGSISFTDTPTASLSRQKSTLQKNSAGVKQTQRSEVKDILQLAREMLDQELAKPPKKQNKKLIQELNDILYGDLSAKAKPPVR